MDYVGCFETAWKLLQKDRSTKEFEPWNEYDIQAHLYYHLYNLLKGSGRILTREYREPPTAQPIDLAILKPKRNMQYEPRLLIEVKKANSRLKRRETIERKIREDLAKLKGRMERLDTPHVRNGVLILFFMNGIDPRMEPVLEQLKKEKWRERVRFRYC